MKVIYVDVFFLINFTVDILALFLAQQIFHIKNSMWRLIFCSFFGAALALVHVLTGENKFNTVVIFIVFCIVLFIFSCKNVAASRRIKFVIAFFALEIFIGGFVNLLYNYIEAMLGDLLSDAEFDPENRKALAFALIILLVIGVIKLILYFLSGAVEEKSVRVRISLFGVTVETDALVDSANLTKDPMGLRPVLFIKKSFASTFLPEEASELCTLGGLDKRMKSRVRLIPVSGIGGTHVLTGIKPDSVQIARNNQYGNYEMTVAIDREGGTFGGYEALVPAGIFE